jgi:16S rRNA (cytosine967-C5)-methyltransferase
MRPALIPVDSLACSLLHAATLVEAVRGGRNLNEAFADCWQAHPELPAATRAAIQDLTYGTLRDFGRGDFLLNRLLHKPLSEPRLHALLLVALQRLERRPEQGYVIVDQAVRAASSLSRSAAKGLVNAVLRNFSRQRESLLAAAEHDPLAHHRHPAWWIRALQHDWPAHWQAILAAGNTHPPMSLRVNRRQTTRQTARAQLGLPAREIGDDGVLLAEPCPVTALPGFAEGLLSVQDAGAQHAAIWLEAQAGMRVLDACAAPGGKTAHILERAEVDLLALDADPARAQRIHQNLERLKLKADVRVADCRAVSSWWNGVPFDRILADVPCSASGVARRHPDIKWLRRERDIAQFAATQREILEALWPLLAEGGQLLYATCSVFRAENQDQIAAFCARHPDAERLPIEGEPEQALPPSAEHDGFYYARIGKRRAKARY